MASITLNGKITKVAGSFAVVIEKFGNVLETAGFSDNEIVCVKIESVKDGAENNNKLRNRN